MQFFHARLLQPGLSSPQQFVNPCRPGNAQRIFFAGIFAVVGSRRAHVLVAHIGSAENIGITRCHRRQVFKRLAAQVFIFVGNGYVRRLKSHRSGLGSRISLVGIDANRAAAQRNLVPVAVHHMVGVVSVADAAGIADIMPYRKHAVVHAGAVDVRQQVNPRAAVKALCLQPAAVVPGVQVAAHVVDVRYHVGRRRRAAVDINRAALAVDFRNRRRRILVNVHLVGCSVAKSL